VRQVRRNSKHLEALGLIVIEREDGRLFYSVAAAEMSAEMSAVYKYRNPTQSHKRRVRKERPASSGDRGRPLPIDQMQAEMAAALANPALPESDKALVRAAMAIPGPETHQDQSPLIPAVAPLPQSCDAPMAARRPLADDLSADFDHSLPPGRSCELIGGTNLAPLPAPEPGVVFERANPGTLEVTGDGMRLVESGQGMLAAGERANDEQKRQTACTNLLAAIEHGRNTPRKCRRQYGVLMQFGRCLAGIADEQTSKFPKFPNSDRAARGLADLVRDVGRRQQSIFDARDPEPGLGSHGDEHKPREPDG
jgi:hypothetical protein